MSDAPGLQHPNIRHLVDPRVDDVISNIFSNLVYLRKQVLNSSTPAPQPITPIQPNMPSYTPAPVIVSGGSGLSSTPVIVDTHATRISTYSGAALPSVGTEFYETDRNALYIVVRDLIGVTGWRLVVAVMESLIATRPTDLSTADNGFIFLNTLTHTFSVWDNPSWFDIQATPVPLSIITVVANYPATSTDDVILSNAAITITLPTAIGIAGKSITIKRIYSLGNTTIATTLAQTIDGSTPWILTGLYDSITVISNGVDWDIL